MHSRQWQEGLSFVIGGCLGKECRNVRVALRIADERMYEDKRRFYKEYLGDAISDWGPCNRRVRVITSRARE